MEVLHPKEIKNLRKEVGLTQSKLAEESDVTQAYIAKIESGNADPKLSTLEKISDTLKKYTPQKGESAKKIMNSPIISIKAGKTIEKAIELMENNDISQIPVIKRKQPVGSLTEETILQEISKEEKPFKTVHENVEKIMEDPFPTVGPKTKLETILPLIKHDPAVLVLKEGEPKGIITKADIIQLPKKEEK